jgi:hypothetical protein
VNRFLAFKLTQRIGFKVSYFFLSLLASSFISSSIMRKISQKMVQNILLSVNEMIIHFNAKQFSQINSSQLNNQKLIITLFEFLIFFFTFKENMRN